MGQALRYLAQCHEACGTYLGTFVLRTAFTRLFAANRTIFVEVTADYLDKLTLNAGDSICGAPLTIQEMFDCAADLCQAMAHDFALHPDPKSGTVCVSDTGLQVLWNHVSQVRTIVEQFDADDLPQRLEAVTASSISAASRIADLPLAGVLDLASMAHLDEYPKWWVDAKKALIAAGRPDDLVPTSARPSQSQPSAGGKGSSADAAGGAQQPEPPADTDKDSEGSGMSLPKATLLTLTTGAGKREVSRSAAQRPWSGKSTSPYWF